MQGSKIHSRNSGNADERERSTSRPRRPWYKRALDGLLLWRQPEAVDAPAQARAGAAHRKRPPPPGWRSSLKKAASAVARAACLCELLCSTDRPVGRRRRRVLTWSPFGRSPRTTLPAGEWGDAPWSSFRERTPAENLLLRRFVLEEEVTKQRREEEVAAYMLWVPPPGSRLRHMSLADDGDNFV